MQAFARIAGTVAIAAAAASASVFAADLTPAQRRIEQTQKLIAAKPDQVQAHNELAMALARRARETSDPAFYTQAQQAIDTARRLAADNNETEKAQIWILLGQHEFGSALERARKLNARIPDDIQVYGLIVDAAAETGAYAEAERAAQWMLDLRPGNIPGLTRAAYLRELFGDLDGATEMMHTALQRIPPVETEERAWAMTQIAHLRLAAGDATQAESVLREALALFPDYHYALGVLARVKLAQGLAPAAVELEQRRYRAAPHPENLFALAQALRRAGRRAEAGTAFAEFERRALAESAGADNANHELVRYYVDVARKPAAALRIAAGELARRRDVHTLDAHAWALHANGRYAEARQAIEAALAIGIRDAEMRYHAGMIAMALKDRKAAAGHLQQSLAWAPNAPFAAHARRVLAQADGRAPHLAMAR